jgi:NADH-quinone oxidoreductase subunit J
MTLLLSFPEIVFYFLASVLLYAGLRVITTRNPVQAALFLVLAFFTAAGIWMLLQAEFLAITLVLVYVGAVMVLFLFVVMMLDINLDRLREGFWEYFPLAGFVGVLIEPAPHAADYSNTAELGHLLYTDYVLPFELAAVILLVAIIAAIALTMRRRKNSKYTDPAQQVKVKRSDRLRIVKMQADVERSDGIDGES